MSADINDRIASILGPGRWTERHWETICMAAHGQDWPDRDEALTKLLEVFRPVLLQFLTINKGIRIEDAEDTINDFILNKILDQKANLLGIVEKREKKSFRPFLKTCLLNYYYYRGRGQKHPEIVQLPNEEVLQSVDIFDIEWVRMVMQQTHKQLKKSCDEEVWQIFRAYYIEPSLTKTKQPTYNQLFEQYNYKNEDQISHLLKQGRKAFKKTFRSVISQSCNSLEEVNTECSHLLHVLSCVEGGLYSILESEG